MCIIHFMNQKPKYRKYRNWAAAFELFRKLLEGNASMAQAVLEQMQGVRVAGEGAKTIQNASPESPAGGNPEQKL